MDRVEVIVHGDKAKWPGLVYEMAKPGKRVGLLDEPRTSPGDQCSCCNHKAKRSRDYCAHAKYSMSQWIPKFSKFAYVI